MENPESAPILFEPIFQERVWGGRRLESAFGKKIPPRKSIGESWEIVDRAEAQSVVRQGHWCGRTLHQLWSDHRREIFGDDVPDTPRFPLLAKLLDAREKLSLQVHPSAEVAASLGGEPKTEAWYVAAADPGAELFFGLRCGTKRDDFADALRKGAVAELVHRLTIKAGDTIFVPSGRLHAIGPGILIVEIQQNSDTTYRVFDWNRRDRDGRERELHLEQGTKSIAFDDFEPGVVRPEGELLVRCPEFTMEKWDLTAPRPALDRRGGALFFCLTGALEMAGVELRPGDFFLVPASARHTPLAPLAPFTSLLRVLLPIR